MAVFMLITLEITAVRGMPIAVPANVPVRPESSPTVKKMESILNFLNYKFKIISINQINI